MELEKAKAPRTVDDRGQASTAIPLQTTSKEDTPSDLPLNRKQILHSKRLYWIGRRTQDILFSSIAILVLWPLVLIFAVLIVIDSPGASPFFVQERVGRNGKLFKFYNLRWMELVRSLHDKLGHIRAYFCTIQTTNLHNAHFRHQNGLFPAAETG